MARTEELATPLDITDRLMLLVRERRPGMADRQIPRALADACGISPQAVRQWFKSAGPNIKLQHLVSMALAFDTTIDWLLMGEGVPPAREPASTLPRAVEPGGYQYQDKQGVTHQVEDLSRGDLLQVACELIDLVEDLDVDASRMAQRIHAWRFGETFDPNRLAGKT